MTTSSADLTWTNAGLELDFSLRSGPVKIIDIRTSGAKDDRTATLARARQPLVEIAIPEFGHGGDESKLIETPIGKRLTYVEHRIDRDETLDRLTITQRDDLTGIVVDSVLEVVKGSPAVRSTNVVSLARGARPVRLQHVASFATAAVISDDLASLDIWSGANSPRAEGRWSPRPLRTPGLRNIDPHERGEFSWSGWQVSGFGSRSTLSHAPAGALVNRKSGTTLAWQVEHNGGWMWEVGELADRARGITPPDRRVRSPHPAGVMQGDSSHDGAYVIVAGPTESRHSWSKVLQQGDSFRTVSATFTIGASLDAALGNLARHRRAARRRRPQDGTLPVIFNDYMNTLVGDPTEDKLLPLIDAAAAVGADYFCVDAGWYDDDDGWWNAVGDWEASTTRFPSGLANVLSHIRRRGMVPGLWMEPEVIGVASKAAQDLPDDAFITRDDVRVNVNDRYFLDMRSPAALAHLDASVDRMIGEYGAAYFKFDYNTTPGTGLDRDADSLGDGLLQNNRALLTWIRGVLDRYPDLLIESCSGGGGRTDFAMLGELHIASTSDQENPLAYPAVAVGSLAQILPEQSGNWAYPQPEMTDQEIAFAMTVGLAGRLYLAGVLSAMSEHQLSIVRAGVQAHNATKHFIATAVPFFPLGFPDWDDSWVAVGFQGEGASADEQLLIVWALPGADPEVKIPIRCSGGTSPQLQRVYPSEELASGWNVDATPGSLHISRPEGLPTAAMFRIISEGTKHD
ncbi:glycoside hydrolase family 36 protein [Microbacterium sp. X-17]|uniref:glycoside hydrolase family 36 protein n=1 Tax=Microbacterium sp. X-17 TaxID=3144404 RepID=UPI0031F49B34